MAGRIRSICKRTTRREIHLRKQRTGSTKLTSTSFLHVLERFDNFLRLRHAFQVWVRTVRYFGQPEAHLKGSGIKQKLKTVSEGKARYSEDIWPDRRTFPYALRNSTRIRGNLSRTFPQSPPKPRVSEHRLHIWCNKLRPPGLYHSSSRKTQLAQQKWR